MTRKKSHAQTTRRSAADVHPMSCAMGDLCRAFLSFPTYGDVAWTLKHPKGSDPKKSKKAA